MQDSSARPPYGILRLGTLSFATLALVAAVALYTTLVAFGNITDFDTNRAFVRHVLAMDTTFRDEDLMWRAVESRGLQDAAYIAVIVWETLTALVLLWSTALWSAAALRTVGDPAARRDRARRAATLGLVMYLLLFGAGFFAIGGEWFAMWQSEDWNGLDAAARAFTFGAVALILVHLPSRR